MSEICAQSITTGMPQYLLKKRLSGNLGKTHSKLLSNFTNQDHTYVSLASTQHRELCVFSEASTAAISAVAYLKAVDDKGHSHVGFCMGKSELAPRHSHNMPHLELCTAVLAVELADMLVDELDIKIHSMKFYTDSVITARTVVFCQYGIQSCRSWHTSSTSCTPRRDKLVFRIFFSQKRGWSFTHSTRLLQMCVRALRPLLRELLQCCLNRFERFSSLMSGLAKLIQKVWSYATAQGEDSPKADELTQARKVVLQTVQQEAFKEEIAKSSQNTAL